jgi:predicted alpha/beta-fold hydrolase
MRRKVAVMPGSFALEPLRRVWTVRQFDDTYTAPHHGFRDAADYYQRASARRVVDRIRVPTLILTAADDPFVPADPFRDPAVTKNDCITLVVTPHGGHCAFLAAAAEGYDGYWAEREIVRFVGMQAGRADRSASDRTPVPSPTLRA